MKRLPVVRYGHTGVRRPLAGRDGRRGLLPGSGELPRELGGLNSGGCGGAGSSAPGHARQPARSGGGLGGGGGVARGGGGAGPPSAMQAAFGAVARTVESNESRYAELADDARHDEVSRMLDVAERKDALATKLDSVTRLTVTAWHCLDCDKLSAYFPKECKEHRKKQVQTVKRFWTCCHCNRGFDTLGVIHPKHRCPRCNDPGKDFKAATMYRGPKGPERDAGSALADRSNFLPRGVEHGFGVHSGM
mmetsp:Transcript_29460/g.87151  ORF Transcript_29460/g.87151 Transcript_29460/m.87151 type:complete len:248 (-) Transcript_29460:554-1297(-)